MSIMVKVKTAELTGKALDWAVADAIDLEKSEKPNVDGVWRRWFQPFGNDGEPWGSLEPFHPSTDWSHGGPLVDEHDVWLSDDEGASVASCYPHTGSRIVEGGTALIAICRAVVVAKLGEEVEVPQELLS